MPDQVFIHGLALETQIGIHAYEKPLRQRLVLHLEMTTKLSISARSGRIEETVDYRSVTERIQAMIHNRSFALVETVADAVATLVLTEYPVQAVRVVLEKPGAVRGADRVGVIIEREARRESAADAPSSVDGNHRTGHIGGIPDKE
jgi:dihydroneopterin aldolase